MIWRQREWLPVLKERQKTLQLKLYWVRHGNFEHWKFNTIGQRRRLENEIHTYYSAYYRTCILQCNDRYTVLKTLIYERNCCCQDQGTYSTYQFPECSRSPQQRLYFSSRMESFQNHRSGKFMGCFVAPKFLYKFWREERCKRVFMMHISCTRVTDWGPIVSDTLSLVSRRKALKCWVFPGSRRGPLRESQFPKERDGQSVIHPGSPFTRMTNAFVSFNVVLCSKLLLTDDSVRRISIFYPLPSWKRAPTVWRTNRRDLASGAALLDEKNNFVIRPLVLHHH